MKIFNITLLILLVFGKISAQQQVLGVDLSTVFSSDTYSCLRNSGYQFAIPRGWQSNGVFDVNAVGNLQRGAAAGLITDVYMFPCRAKSATDQVNTFINDLGGAPYGMIWIDVEINPSCDWGTDYNGNCSYLQQLVQAVQNRGRTPGIYGSRYMWQTIFGGYNNCPYFTNLGVWYANYDGVANFNNWDSVSFGGWARPNIQQYQGTTTVCGGGVDLNFY